MPGLVKLVNSAVAVSDAQGSDMQPIALAEPLLSLLESKPFQLPLRQVVASILAAFQREHLSILCCMLHSPTFQGMPLAPLSLEYVKHSAV